MAFNDTRVYQYALELLSRTSPPSTDTVRTDETVHQQALRLLLTAKLPFLTPISSNIFIFTNHRNVASKELVINRIYRTESGVEQCRTSTISLPPTHEGYGGDLTFPRPTANQDFISNRLHDMVESGEIRVLTPAKIYFLKSLLINKRNDTPLPSAYVFSIKAEVECQILEILTQHSVSR